jgi:hypothetical protein
MSRRPEGGARRDREQDRVIVEDVTDVAVERILGGERADLGRGGRDGGLRRLVRRLRIGRRLRDGAAQQQEQGHEDDPQRHDACNLLQRRGGASLGAAAAPAR